MKYLKNIKQNRAITLIALVVTVVVLIILVAVVTAQITTKGIINQAKQAGQLYSNAQGEEKDMLENYDFNLASTRDGADTSPIGTIIAYMGGTTAPGGYLACDGTELNIADYPELAAQFETGFGSKNYFGGDGVATFKVPNLQGEFLRGYSTGTTSSVTNGVETAAIGKHQDGTVHAGVYSGNSANQIGIAKTPWNHTNQKSQSKADSSISSPRCHAFCNRIELYD